LPSATQAIISGCFAAEAIIDHFQTGATLGAYEKRLRACLGPALKNSLRTKNMGYAFLRGDLITEAVLRILGPIGGIKRAMECEKPLWLL
jgi:flavin-dependent dehydrogenase